MDSGALWVRTASLSSVVREGCLYDCVRSIPPEVVNASFIFCLRALSAAEAAILVNDGVELSDNQARIFFLPFSTDILLLDTPSNLDRYVEHGCGSLGGIGAACASRVTP